MPFIAYQTLWSEGVVVAHTDDKEFAIGTDQILGHTVYVTKEELPRTSGYQKIAEFDNPEYIGKFDSSYYQRKK